MVLSNSIVRRLVVLVPTLTYWPRGRHELWKNKCSFFLLGSLRSLRSLRAGGICRMRLRGVVSTSTSMIGRILSAEGYEICPNHRDY